MKKLNLDEEKVIELYHKIKSSNKVAKELGCGVAPILNILKKNKIETYGFLGAWGKDNGMYGRRHSPEARELSKIARTKQNGINHPMYGRHHTEEARKNISLSKKGKLCGKENPMYGRKQSEQMKQRCLLTKIKNNSLPKGEKNGMYGRKHKEISKSLMSEKHKGKTLEQRFGYEKAEEIKKLLSMRTKGRKSSLKNKTFDEFYGKERAEEIKELLSKAGINSWSNEEYKKSMVEKLRIASKSEKRIVNLRLACKGRKYPLLSKETKEKIKIARAKQIIPLQDTKIEIKIQNFLKELGIEHFTHFYISEIKHRYRCDVFIPSIKTIIECDGDYWHGNPEKYSESNLREHQMKQRERDEARTKELKERGYNVIRLWESEIKEMEINKFKEILNG